MGNKHTSVVMGKILNKVATLHRNEVQTTSLDTKDEIERYVKFLKYSISEFINPAIKEARKYHFVMELWDTETKGWSVLVKYGDAGNDPTFKPFEPLSVSFFVDRLLIELPQNCKGLHFKANQTQASVKYTKTIAVIEAPSEDICIDRSKFGPGEKKCKRGISQLAIATDVSSVLNNCWAAVQQARGYSCKSCGAIPNGRCTHVPKSRDFTLNDIELQEKQKKANVVKKNKVYTKARPVVKKVGFNESFLEATDEEKEACSSVRVLGSDSPLGE